MVDKLQRIFLQKTREAWIQILVQADVPVSPVQTFKRIPQDPHVIFREMIQEITLSSGERIKQTGIPFKMSEMPGKIRIPVPQLGEHTWEVLESLGYSLEQMEGLKREGAI